MLVKPMVNHDKPAIKNHKFVVFGFIVLDLPH